jgi:hypothetical protein
MLEIVLAILDHLHIREPLIVWGLFILGLILISDSILRSDWARTPTEKAARTKRRTYGMLPVVILFSIFGYYIFKVERPIPTGSIDKSEPPIPANKQPDTNQAPETKPAQQLHAEKKKPRPTTTQPPATPPSQVCPNGICVGGDNNGTATVNNNYGKLPDQPQPGTIPTVIVCSSISAVGKGYVTNITLQTDSPITKPAYGFLFDGPVGGGEISISGIPKPKVPYVNQLQLQGYEDRSYVLRFISEDFPNGEITFTNQSGASRSAWHLWLGTERII